MRKTLMVFLSMAAGWAHAQMSPIGLWQSIDDGNGQPKAEILIAQRPDGGLTGKVERSLLANPGTDTTCVLCTDDRRNQPKVGLEIIRGVKKSAGHEYWDGGEILDPEEGKLYRVRLTPLDGGAKLQVRGFLGPFWRNQLWVKAP